MKKEIRSLLRKRAALLAMKAEPDTEVSGFIELLDFFTGSERFGIELTFIREVHSLRDLTVLPGTPPHIKGIINLHGQIVPVVGLIEFFGLPEKETAESAKVIIMEDEQTEFGILADRIMGIIKVAFDEIEPVPPSVTGINEKFLKGMTPGEDVIISMAPQSWPMRELS